MTEISKRLKVNLKNIKRPIKGVLPKRITRDTYGLEIPLRVFSRIKYDCNVYYTGKDKDIVITNEQQFLELLKEHEVPEKTVTFEKIEKPIDIPNSQEINVEPDTEEIFKELESDNIVAEAREEYLKCAQEETDNQLLNDISVYEEKTEATEQLEEQVEEIPITTKDGATVGVRKNNKRNRR